MTGRYFVRAFKLSNTHFAKQLNEDLLSLRLGIGMSNDAVWIERLWEQIGSGRAGT